MGPSCPQCKESDFSYRALLSVHPYFGEFRPARITCPSCGAALRVTVKSRLLSATVVLLLVIASGVLLVKAGNHLYRWQILIVVAGILAFYYLAIWPLVVQLTPWTDFQYWLPKSRLVGYSVYLLLPVAAIALFLYLAVKFGLGM